jgi:transposase
MDGPELDLRLLVDHRERFVRQRVGLNSTLQWHLHDLWPELELPASSLVYGRWRPGSPAARQGCADDARPHRPTSCGVSASSPRRSIKALEAEIAGLVGAIAPQLLSEPGV